MLHYNKIYNQQFNVDPTWFMLYCQSLSNYLLLLE